jgi:hypothetical protein
MKLKVVIIPLLFIVAFSLIVSVISQAEHTKSAKPAAVKKFKNQKAGLDTKNAA